MSLPTRDDALTMDISYLGAPWIKVCAKSGIDPSTMDISYLGAPWWGLEDTGGQPTQHYVFRGIGRITGAINLELTSNYYSRLGRQKTPGSIDPKNG